MSKSKIAVTGVGILSSLGCGIEKFNEALLNGRSGFEKYDSPFIPYIAPLSEQVANEFRMPENAPDEMKQRADKILRRMPFSVKTATYAVVEAMNSAGLIDAGTEQKDDIAIVAGGSNMSAKFEFDAFCKFLDAPEYVRPSYAIQHFDTNYIGVISEILDIHGPGMTTGGASASGNVCLIEGMRLIKSQDASVCICFAPIYECPEIELSSFVNLRAFGDYSVFENPCEASRPFDERHAGFVPGQAAACIILEESGHAVARNAEILGYMSGGAIVLDGNHLSNANSKGEERAIRKAIYNAGITPYDIDYVNAHGTSTPGGDAMEAEALLKVFNSSKSGKPLINSTKSLTGHCMYSAGIVEAIACICQLRGGYVHGNKNLDKAICDELNFPKKTLREQSMRYALSNSFGFGGINTAIVIEK